MHPRTFPQKDANEKASRIHSCFRRALAYKYFFEAFAGTSDLKCTWDKVTVCPFITPEGKVRGAEHSEKEVMNRQVEKAHGLIPLKKYAGSHADKPPRTPLQKSIHYCEECEEWLVGAHAAEFHYLQHVASDTEKLGNDPLSCTTASKLGAKSAGLRRCPFCLFNNEMDATSRMNGMLCRFTLEHTSQCFGSGQAPVPFSFGMARKWIMDTVRGLEFDDLQRAAFPGHLHRMAVEYNRPKEATQLSMRVARVVQGPAMVFPDLLIQNRSILIAAPPGRGKTTLLRDFVRVLQELAPDRKIILVDRSDEIGGAADVPHRCLGSNVQVDHSADVVVVDEIGGADEANIGAGPQEPRGVTVIATCHGGLATYLRRGFRGGGKLLGVAMQSERPLAFWHPAAFFKNS
ncbi:hypothetical protein HDU87_000129 [Geranomyces variabilis]|uniref:AAA+ ATPase domain-containing protein n=1 Tax=Geranomyces variabilis TaxID=109894 RepID=A0AAD5TS18_9FUNG|nr:hypothetical protein HDU87_000129 [Geranomyces variabilis]